MPEERDHQLGGPLEGEGGAIGRYHLRNGQKLEYGLGWEVYKDEFNHSGLWMGFSSDYLRRPKQRLSVIVLSNSSETDAEGLARETAKIFAE